MIEDQTEQFLQKMKGLVRNGKRYFVRRNRKGIPYIQQLADLGLTGVEEAWEVVLMLTKEHWFKGPEEDWDDRQAGEVVWVFKMEVNGTLAYIKLKDEELKRGCVCLSFHEDQP